MVEYAAPTAALERVGSRSRPRLIFRGLDGLRLAMRLCRDGDRSLGQLLTRIPDEYVSNACTVGRGPEAYVVACPCGATVFTSTDLTECPGGCGRWMVADDAGAWSIRLSEQETD